MLGRGLTPEQVADLYDELGEPLLRWFSRQVRDRDEAADLWSETWARVVASRRRVKGDSRAEHAAFVYTTARNLLTDWGRRGIVRRRALDQLGMLPLRLPEAPALPDDDPAALAELARLPADQAAAVRMRVVDDLEYDEIARRLDSTEPAVRQKVSRGLKRLRGRLEERGDA
jgi:RNA polymerase sigma-70 factor, ECF subfamily